MAIDLDAARRERQTPDGLPVTLGGITFTLPAEFPVDVIDPFLSDEFDLAGLIREAMALSKNADGSNRPLESVVVDVLFLRPSVPVDVVNTAFAALEVLFGTDQWSQFKTQRPSLPDYAVLVRSLIKEYGVSLGEAFASLASSESGGTTPNATSSASTDSTPAPSGDAPEPSTGS